MLTLQILVIDSTADDRLMNPKNGGCGGLQESMQMSWTILEEILLILYDQFAKGKQGAGTMADTIVNLFQFLFFGLQIPGSFSGTICF